MHTPSPYTLPTAADFRRYLHAIPARNRPNIQQCKTLLEGARTHLLTSQVFRRSDALENVRFWSHRCVEDSLRVIVRLTYPRTIITSPAARARATAHAATELGLNLSLWEAACTSEDAADRLISDAHMAHGRAVAELLNSRMPLSACAKE